MLVRGPFVSGQGTGFEREGLAGEQGVQVVAQFAVWVAFYEQVDVAG